ncbi:hypothetical protein B0T11DRAFT_82921 [Plectosphaerella cucumerina]|uniref:FAD-binding domain-containing protein n=1 Tax=Plectosphaerella cucumerina TaxID=40658 RepID=A0A8K0THN6_9PEZI|nr:hypothetical protein B0T11DRAFT_82921 [Plectosphaerella cucumerina]
MAPLKVIVVGGGPNGITAAHALQRAGIDFVVLERRQSVLEDTGASLVLSPHNQRVYHQLGLLDKILAIGEPLLHVTLSFGPESNVFKRTYGLSRLPENHGAPVVIFHRVQLLKVLFDGLPQEAKDRYLTNKKLVDIKTSDSGVEVTCEDGTSYTGDIVLGADGVHSRTRSIMRRLALQSDPSLASAWDPELPFPAHYKCLWASFTRQTEPGESYETQSNGRSAMYLTGKERGWIFLYEKLPQPTTERIDYDEKDIRAYAETFADWQVHEKLKIPDIIDHESFVAGMGNLQEGIAQRKSWAGRIVLVGDAAHRFTPNAGLGLNSGIQDVVSLSNHLKELVDKPDAVLDAQSLEEVFQKYQDERKIPLANDYDDAAKATRLQAWATWVYRVVARYIFSLGAVRNFLASHRAAAGIKSGFVLNYVPAREPFTGKVPWDHRLKEELD